MSSSSSSSPAAAAKICFNSQCKEPKSDPPPRRKGWRLRSGDHAELCDRCSCTYEQGNFCETFHTDASGWRKCESCGKRVHCGCIVSASAYLLLDAGGVECIACARKGLAMAPNQMWSPLLLSAQVSERPKEFPLKSWNQMTGAYPGQWRQAAHMWNNTSAQSDLHQRLSYEFDRPMHGGRSSISMQEKKIENLPERTVSSSLNHMRYANGTTGPEQASAFNMYHKDETSTDAFPDSGQLLSDNDLMSTRKAMNSDPCSTSSGFNLEPHASLCTMGQSSSVLKGDASSLLIGLAAPFASLNGANDLSRISSTTQMQRQMPPPLPKQLHPSSQNMADSCGELQTQMRNGRPRAEARVRTQLLPRYWPRITDQELQQISGDSNSVITPLFEKMLSASDAGRIGRLVLPKKCAEAYFPPISHPEGLPLKVQDATGKEWIFQFRFWPNNNSRMYVLEGVTPCIQSMQLQAGDTVTFSRIDPEGKLVMGFRKASNISIEQDSQTTRAGNGFSAPQEVNNKNTVADFAGNLPVHPPKRDTELGNSINAEDQSVVWSKFDKAGFIQKEVSATKSSQALNKRKGSILGSKNKRLRIENEDSIELKLSWEEAQGLLRPPPNGVPSVVVIDGHEFEEYEEAPVLGKPTIFTTKQTGEKHQWAQCDDCSKWRKLPVDALLPSTWTCADNRWDPERCSCSSSQETSMELADILPSKSGPSKRSKIKVEDSNIEVSDGLDTLANLAILGEGEALPASAQAATTKHPRHRPGCTCIVCIQPPSGKGPKHKQTCTCNVCLTVKRRFRTLMLRREKRQSEKDAETAALKQQKQLAQSSEMLPQLEANSPITGKNIVGSLPQTPLGNNEVVLVDDESERRKTMPSPIKTQIDLNIQPEREEEPSPVSDAGKVVRPFRDATS